MEQQRLHHEGACSTDCWRMEQQRLYHEGACSTDCWRMEQQRLHHEGACSTDCWRMEQQRLHHEGACSTDCWRMEQQRLHHEGACSTDCWRMEQQRLHHEGACSTDCWRMEQQRFNTKRTCAKCQCQRYSADYTCLDHSVLDHPVKCIKPFVSHDNDVVKITQTTGGIINIYNHPTTEGRKSCDHVRSNNNQETEETCLKERRRTNSKWKRNPFRKLYSFCRKKRNPSLSPERPRNPIQTVHNKGEKIHIRNSYCHKAAQNITDKDSILSDRTDGANIQVEKAGQLEESQLTQCHSSHVSSKPKALKNTARCQKESPLSSNKWTTENKRNIDSPSEHRNRESKESFENLGDVFSVRPCYDSLSLQESNTDTQKRQPGTCEVFEPCKHTSSCDQLQNKTSKEFETQIKRHKRTSTISSVNLEKNVFFDVDGESVFDDENNNDDLLRDHNENTDKKQTPCQFDRCELDTELTFLKLPDLMHIQEQTEAKASTTLRLTSTESSTQERTLSSGYPWDTNSKITDGLSKDICHSSDFTKYTETSFESTNCFKEDILRKSFQNKPAQSHKIIDTDAEKIKESKKSFDVIHVFQTTNEENSCSYNNGKDEQFSRISDGEEGAVCNKSCGNDTNIDPIDFGSYDSNGSQCDKNTSLNLVSSNLPRPSNSKELNEEVNSFDTDGSVNIKSLIFKTAIQKRSTHEETPTSLLHRSLMKVDINMSVPNEHVKTGNPNQAVNEITENHTRENRVSSVQSNINSDFQSVPFIGKDKKERKRHNSENFDSGYESSTIRQPTQTVYTRVLESSERRIHEKQINNEIDSDTSVDLLPPKAKTHTDNDCTTKTLSTSESKGLQLSAGCGNIFSPDFPFEHKDVCFINSYKCTPLIAICLDEVNFSVIKVSDDGMLQEEEFVLNKDYHIEDGNKPERNRIESKDHYYMNTLRLKDTNDVNDGDNVCGDYDGDNGCGGGNYDDEYSGPQSEMTDVDKKSALDNTGNNVFPISLLRGTKTRKEKKCKEKQTKHDTNYHKRQKHNATRTNLKSRNACFPSHKRLLSGKYVNNSDTQKYVDSSSKPNESTKTNKMKRRECHYSCHTKVPKPEITSAFFQESMHQSSSVFPSEPSKLKSDQRKKNKKSYFKRSWQTDGKLFGWQLTDSGIGTSDHSENSSVQQLKENENSFYLIEFKIVNLTKGKGSCKILPYLVKKKSDLQQLRKLLRKFISKRRRTFVRKFVREINIVPRRTEKNYVLDKYFNDIFNGTRFTERSRLRYELLRLESFRNYTGNGSALVLARNGFFHDHNEGPGATRCYLCNAQNSNWEMFDDVRAEHRRQSPDCPFNSDSGQESQNIPITDNSEALPTHGGLSTASNNTAFTTARPADLNLTETSETGATAAFQRPQISGDLSTGSESISQQPTEDRESRDRSLFALPRPRPQKAIGRPGQSYSTILAPKRNNVAKGAESNVGLDPTEGNSGAPGASNSNRIPSNQSQSVLAGPVAAGAFAGLSTRAQITVSSATEALQGSSAPSAATSTTEGSGPEPRTGGEADPAFTVVVDNPRHPTYQNIETRTNSYQGWPDYLDQSPSQMAEAGFFFVGVADFTRCFCCGGGLRNWEPGDDPMLEHTRWFPRCEYVKKLKGERYVAAVQRRHQEHMAEQQRQQVELAQRRDEHRNPSDPMTTEVAEVLLEMGYSAERIREAILAVRQQRGLSEVTAQQVLTWLLDEEEQRLNINTETGTETSTANTTTAAAAPDVQQTVSSITVSTENTSETGNEPSEDNETVPVAGPVNSSNNSPSIHTEQKQPAASTSTGQRTGTAAKPGSSSEESEKSKLTANGTNNGTTIRETKKKKTRKKTKGKGSGTASSAAGELDAKSLKAENEKLREMQTCKICMERPVNTTLLPCGHLVCCGSCAPRLQRCPICRKTIKGTVKTFMS